MEIKILQCCRKISQSSLIILIVLGSVVVLPLPAIAGPGKLSDVPLYVGAGVKPNVLYVVDDSYSMESKVLKSASAEMIYPDTSTLNQINAGNQDLFYFKEAYYELALINPTTKLDALELCRGYNVLAYNPDNIYPHWQGRDSQVPNQAFDDMSISSARYDPRFTSGFDRNLTDAVIMPWDDADNDGEFDPGECHEQVVDAEGEPVPPSAALTDEVRSHLIGFNSSDMPGLTEEQLEFQKMNFANWYTYYRSRNNTMISALSSVLSESEQRVGLATINNSSSAARQITDLEQSNNRDVLVQRSVNIRPVPQGTPLERALDNAGKYFSKDLSPETDFLGSSAPSPIVSLESGGACQQNYTVLMTDGYSEADYGEPMSAIAYRYYSDSLAPEYPNLVNANNPLDTATHPHMVTHAVAFGVAGNFSSKEVVTKSLEEAPNDHSKRQDFLENNTNNEGTKWWTAASIFDFDEVHYADWPTTIAAKSPDTIDDLFHATVMGRGKFFNSSNPRELINDLREIEDAIADDAQGTAASVGFNSTSIDSETLLFQGWFDTSTWHGELRAYEYTDGVAPDSSDLEWEAGGLLAQRVDPENTSASPRQIITFNGVHGVPFLAPAGITDSDLGETTLSESQVRDLMTLAPFDFDTTSVSELTHNQTYLENVVAYLRGDVTLDGEPIYTPDADEALVTDRKFRARVDQKVLGDIVHSSPVIVGAPSEPYPNNIESGSPYISSFVAPNSDRMPVLYVGANDGMLHAFKATNRPDGRGESSQGGDELFAYIPGILFSSEHEQGLHHLTSEGYLNKHRAYVDGPLTPADVFVDGAWRTYLVGTLGAGGKGVYVLDITNPSNFSESNASDLVKMEFTHANLGYTFARPQIAKLNNGDWAAIFGNGYNNNGSYKASLFILYLDGHEGEGSTGDPYREITTDVGQADDCNNMDSECNGLSSPSILDITGDSVVDRAYAGDILGNLWAFDLSSDDPDDWGVAHEESGVSQPLFRACRTAITSGSTCPAGDRQPITVRPVVVSHPSKRSFTTDPNLLVFFGTGQYLAEGDTEDSAGGGTEELVFSARAQSVYAVWDAGTAEGNLQASDLVAQTISDGMDAFNEPDGTRSLSANLVNYSVGIGGVYGWSAALPATKERLVVNPLSVGRFVIFTTTIPSNEACLGGGSGYLMIARLVDGTQPRFRAFPNRDPDISGFVLNAAPGGPQIIDNDIVVPDYQGEILSEDFIAAQPRPSRRAAWSILK